MRPPAVNFRHLTKLARAHLALLFVVFTLATAAATGLVFVRAFVLIDQIPPAPALTKTKAENVNRSLRDDIFARINQRTADISAALTTPVKDPF